MWDVGRKGNKRNQQKTVRGKEREQVGTGKEPFSLHQLFGNLPVG